MINIISNISYYLAYNMIIKPKNYELGKYFKGKKGLEIGGPSAIFKKEGSLPIYSQIRELDNCDFSDHTVWRNKIEEKEYKFGNGKTGKQFITDASDLTMIDDDVYDFIVCSNVIEHIANPIKALVEWRRVLKKDGLLLIVAPNKVTNFDHNRETTSFEHIKKDYENEIKENDLTHLSEIMEKHDYKMDIGARTKKLFYKRSQENYKNRTLHHHVYNTQLLKELYLYVGIRPIMVQNLYTDFMILGKK